MFFTFLFANSDQSTNMDGRVITVEAKNIWGQTWRILRARLQWLVFFSFFRQTTDLIVYVPLCSTTFTLFTVNPAVTGSSPCFSQNLFRVFAKADETEGSPLSIFSALCDFCARRVPPFTFSKTLRFLSLRYRADFRRSRHIHTKRITIFCS